MHPQLDLAGLRLPAYGLALSVGFLLGIVWAAHRARRRGLDAEIALEVGIVAIVCALLGARVFYLALHPPALAESGGLLRALLPAFAPGDRGRIAGLSVMGGLPAAVSGVVALLLARRQPLWTWVDLLSPPVALGAAVTRLGCFANGCCYGTPSGVPWAVAFPPGSLPHRALGDVPLHPTQLYASLAALVIVGVLLRLERRHPAPGLVFASLLALLGLQRLAIGALRHHSPAETLARIGDVPVSHYQVAAAALLLAGLALGALRLRPGAAGSGERRERGPGRNRGSARRRGPAERDRS